MNQQPQQNNSWGYPPPDSQPFSQQPQQFQQSSYGYPSQPPQPQQQSQYGYPQNIQQGMPQGMPQGMQQGAQPGMQQGLSVRVESARGIKNMDTMRKQDPYVVLSVDFNIPHPARSFTHKDGGTEPKWSQELQVDTHGASELYVEIWDEDPGADDLSAFCAIPLQQVPIDGWFQTYTLDGKPKGEINLILLPPSYSGPRLQPSRGASVMNPQHQKYLVSKSRKGTAADIGVGLLGIGLAAGAAHLAEQAIKNNEKKDQEIQRLHEEERRTLQEQEQHRTTTITHSQYANEGEKYHHHGLRAWEPNGTYSQGDRVEYNGRQWVCLQGFTSNPTWTPEAAPSLWRQD